MNEKISVFVFCVEAIIYVIRMTVPLKKLFQFSFRRFLSQGLCLFISISDQKIMILTVRRETRKCFTHSLIITGLF